LDSLATFFETLWGDGAGAAKIPEISEIPDDLLATTLTNNVPAYSHAKITRSSLPTEQLQRLPKVLERFKLFRLNQLATLQRRYQLPMAAVIKGSPWPMKPPVVEKWGDEFVIVDGAHRAYTAYLHGEDTLDVLLVENVSEPLPARPFRGWEDVSISTPKLDRVARYDGFQEKLFRPIAAALNQIAVA
jgi:hypothetical protein